MAATLRGAFEIVDRASRPIRKIRDAALEADAAVSSLGANLDRIGTQHQRQMMDNTASQIRMLGAESHTSADEADVLAKRLENVGAPRIVKDIDTTNKAIVNTGRAAKNADRDVGTLDNGMKRLTRSTRDGEGALDKLTRRVTNLRAPMMALMIPMVGLAAQGIGGLLTGVTALLPKLTDLAGAGVALVPAFVGVGLAMTSAKLAFHGLSQAMAGNKKALSALSPEARQFITVLKEYQPVIDKLRRSAQAGLFPGLEQAMRKLNAGTPVAQSLLKAAGSRLGGLASNAAGQLTSHGFLRDLEMIGNEGLHVLDRLGRGMLNLLQAVRNVAVAGLPFTHWLSDAFLRMTEGAKSASMLGRETGRLSSYFLRVQQSMQTLGRVGRNLWDVFKAIGHAIRPLGDDLWASIDKVTRGWARFLSSSKGQRDMRGYFEGMRAPLHQLVGFFGDLARGLGKLSAGTGFTDAMVALRAALPGLVQGLGTMASTLGPQIITMFSQVLQLATNLVGGTGPLTTMLKVLNGVLGTVNTLITHVPALGAVLGAAFSVLLWRRAATGVQGFATKLLGLGGTARTAAAGMRDLAVAEREVAAAGAGLGLGGAAVRSAGAGAALSAVPWAATTGAVEGEAAALARRGPIAAGSMPSPGQMSLFPAAVLGSTARLGAAGTAGAAETAAARGAMSGGMGGLGLTAAALWASKGGAARRGLGAATRGLRSVGRFAGPVLAISAVADAIGTPGNTEDRVRGALSGATLGLLHMPTAAERTQQGIARAQQQFGSSVPVTLAGLRRRQTQVRGRLADAVAHSQSHATEFLGVKISDDRGLFGKSGDAADRNKAAATEYRKQLKLIAAGLQDLRKQTVAVARQNGMEYAQGLGEAFNVYDRKMGLHKGFSQTIQDTLHEMGKMGPEGRRSLAASMTEWAQEQARYNPKLVGQVRQLQHQINGEFAKLRDGAKIVNGQILTNTQTSWNKVAAAITGPTESAMETALQSLSKGFTAFQQTAISQLGQMGFTQAEARSYVSGAENISNGTSTPASAFHMGDPGPGSGPTTTSHKKGGARGARISGVGLRDTVPVAPGWLAAPGELIVNRHTENRIDSKLAAFGTSLGREVGAENRPHSAPMGYAYGGRAMTGDRVGAVGAIGGGLHPGIAAAVAQLLGHFPGLSVTSTTGGKHAAGSYHYLGEAADIGGSSSLMLRAADWIKSSGMAGSLTEGIHNPNLSIKGGQNVPASFWGSTVWGQHANHIHMAVAGALAAFSGAGGSSLGAGGVGSLKLPLTTPGRGIPGAMASASMNAVARGMMAKINSRIGGAAPGGGGLSGGTSGTNQALGRAMMLAHGWGADQWPSLKALWTQESGWNANAVNPTSGAYGIPQALGHGHPFALGDARGQIAWGLDYIAGRYGSPAAAEAHEQASNWYAMGGRTPSQIGWGGWNAAGGSGRANRATLLGFAEGAVPETVHITPERQMAGTGAAAAGGPGRHVVVNFHPGSIVVHGHGEAAASDMVDQMMHKLAGALEGMGLESEVQIA